MKNLKKKMRSCDVDMVKEDMPNAQNGRNDAMMSLEMGALNIYLDEVSAFNYGSAMLATNFIYHLNKRGGFMFYAATKSESETNRLGEMSKTNIKRFSIDPYMGAFMKNEPKIIKIVRYLPYPVTAAHRIKNNFDAFVFLGGDTLSQRYFSSGTIMKLLKIKLISISIPTFLVGLTIGPFKPHTKKLAEVCLRDAYIYTRDQGTYSYLTKELKLKNICSSSDLAFLELPMQADQSEKSKILEKYGLIENEYITVIPSGLYKKYTTDFEGYISTWADILKRLLGQNIFKNKKIVLLAHVIQPPDVDDRIIIDNIININQDISPRIIPIIDELMPHEARIILGNGLFTITGRMHGAVSTFQMGKPAISLSYSVKYRGVIGEGLKLPNLIIESSDARLWENGDIVTKVVDRVNYVVENYASLLKSINQNAELSKNIALCSIEAVAKVLHGLKND